MAYQALYRKWRPSTFSEIVGQKHITTTLQNEIKSGKIAQAYLFCGSRGTGKTTTARVFSKAVNCLHPVEGNPCNVCSVCQGITDGSLMDIVEIDAASNNGVDNIRAINSEVSYLPSGVTYKIYIIDEVHMLSASAFNALLKTLEEPPSHVIFILATTESHKIPDTILSRCQRFDFKRISLDPMLERLRIVAEQDGIQITDSALSLIMKSADGSMRDALSLLDQCSSGSIGEIDADLVRTITGGPESARMLSLGDAILQYQPQEVFLQIRQAIAKGFDAVRLLEGLMEYFRNLVVCKTSGGSGSLLDLPSEELAQLAKQAEGVPLTRCLSALDILFQAYDSTRWAKNPRLILEMALIKLSHPKTEETNLLSRLERVESLLEQGVSVQIKPQTAPVMEEVKQPSIVVEEVEETVPPIVEEVKQPTSVERAPAPMVEPEMTPVKPDQEEPSVKSVDISALITSHWPDILDQIERQGNPLLSGAMRSGEFRIQEEQLHLIDLLPMLNNPQNQALVEQVVQEICGVQMKVTFADFDPSGSQKDSRQSDPLQQLAKSLEHKINIID